MASEARVCARADHSSTSSRVSPNCRAVPAEEIAAMTTPEGRVTADCQFCGAHYEFDPASLGFEATVDPEGNPIEAPGA